MHEVKAVFDLLYERRRLLTKDLESIEGAIKALQLKCDHERLQEDDPRCSICGLKLPM